jgi:hypothetical protein
MALQTQGSKIRRQSTAAGATAVTNLSSATAMDFVATAINWHAAAGDFVAAGFTTGMRIWHNATINKYGFTVHTVAATQLGVLETMTTSTGLSFVVHGAKMTEIGGITGFSVPTGAAAVIDVTNIGSTAKEKIIGFVDEGQMTFEVNIDSSEHIQFNHLTSDRKTRTKRTYDVQFSDKTATDSTAVPSGILFDGYVTGFALTGGVDAPEKGSITIEIDGPTYWSSKAS